MHGASSVPQLYVNLINQYGGNIPETYGVPIEAIQQGINNGIRKVNIDTDLRLAFTAAMYVTQSEDNRTFDPRHFCGLARAYMRTVCMDRFEAFGCSGQALTMNNAST